MKFPKLVPGGCVIAGAVLATAVVILWFGLETIWREAETQAPASKAQTYPAPTTLRECLDWYAAIDYACAEVALPDDLHDMDL